MCERMPVGWNEQNGCIYERLHLKGIAFQANDRPCTCGNTFRPAAPNVNAETARVSNSHGSERAKVSITEQEDALFCLWRESVKDGQFVIDGAPSPALFETSPARCLVVLKEPNFDPKDQDTTPFNQRDELATQPDAWWNTVKNWCAGISALHEGHSLTWDQLKALDLRAALQPFAFMQLKKTTGNGLVVSDNFRNRVRNDGDFILAQMAIYKPKVVIACGVAAEIERLCGVIGAWRTTTRGVRFNQIMIGGQAATLIDVPHPSARVADHVLCFSLLDAYREVVLGQ